MCLGGHGLTLVWAAAGRAEEKQGGDQQAHRRVLIGAPGWRGGGNAAYLAGHSTHRERPMSTYEARLAALREQLKADRLDGFVVPLTDEHMSEYVGSYAQRLAWLTGFQGSAGVGGGAARGSGDLRRRPLHACRSATRSTAITGATSRCRRPASPTG